MHDHRHARILSALAVVAATAMLTGCGIRIPTDPEGTLDRVTGGELRVGASPDGALIELDADDEPAGPLPDIVEDFAESLDAEITWTVGSEESLVADLERHRLDLVIGGVTDQTPWSDRVAVTRGYPGLAGAQGDRAVVLLAPMGENAFVSRLEAHLDAEVAEAAR